MKTIFTTVAATVMVGALAVPAFAEMKTPANQVTCKEFAEGESSAQHEMMDAMYAHAALIGSGRNGANVVGTPPVAASGATKAGDNPNGRTDESRKASNEDVAALVAACKADPDMMAVQKLVVMPPSNDVK